MKAIKINMSEKVKLYRVENPNIPVNPLNEGVNGTSDPGIRGQWFSTSIDKALQYLPKATQYKPGSSVPMDGAVVHVAEIDSGDLESYRAANHPVVQEMKMDIEPSEDYIVPRDAIVSTLPVDDIVGESRGKMNRLDERRMATDRVRGAVALNLVQMNKS